MLNGSKPVVVQRCSDRAITIGLIIKIAGTFALTRPVSVHVHLITISRAQSRRFVHRLSARIINVLFAFGAHVVLCQVGPQKLASGSGLIKFLFLICRGWTVGVGGP